MREDERGWAASGMGVDVDGTSGLINGSGGGDQLWGPLP